MKRLLAFGTALITIGAAGGFGLGIAAADETPVAEHLPHQIRDGGVAFFGLVTNGGGDDLTSARDDRERLPHGLELHHLDAVVADIEPDRQNL